MKKEERLHRLLGDIDDELVADAARKPIRKAVWVPAVAAAACVALAVGLWQGGVFDPAPIPVETPDEGASVTEPAETSKDTTTTPAKSTDPSKSETTKTTASSKTETTKTTTTTDSYILVGGEEDSNTVSNGSVPSLKDRLVSPALEEKMKEYRDVNAVYQVVVHSALTIEDHMEAEKLVEADKEYQSLQKQYEKAVKVYKEASKRWGDCEYPYDDPRGAAVWHEQDDADKKKTELLRKRNKYRSDFVGKYYYALAKERISYASKYSKTKPLSGYGINGSGYYMELTADAINELADRGGYSFELAGEKRKEGIYEVVNW